MFSLRQFVLSLCLLAVVLAAAAPLAAQDSPRGDSPSAKEPLPPPETEKEGEEPAAGEEKQSGDGRLKGDWKVYVPFKNLKDVFEKEGQGVFVPFEEFLRLWEANLDRRPPPTEPPVPFLVTRAEYRGEVVGELATLTAEIHFETFTKGWSAVPLGFAGIAVGEATLDGKAATLESTADGYRIHVSKKGAYALIVQFVAPVTKKENIRHIAFRAPPTPVSRLTFDVPEKDAIVTVSPNLATTRTDATKGVTRIMAYVGAAAEIRLSWRPRGKRIERGPALLFADQTLTAAVEENALRLNANVAWSIFRSPVGSFKLAVPDDVKVLFVEGAHLKTWSHENGVLTIQLHQVAEKNYRVILTMEAPLPKDGPVAVPSVRALDVAREQGFVLIRAPKTVKVVPTAESLYRSDFAAVPKPPKDLVLAYRYPAHPWSLSLDVTRITPEITVDVRTRHALTERNLTCLDRLTYQVKKAAIFTARVELPPDVTVVDVKRDVVEDYRIVTEGDRRFLVLELKGSRIGAFTVTITTSRPIEMKEKTLDLAIPFLTPRDVDKVRGTIGIARDPGLKLETKEAKGLSPIAAAAFGEAATIAWTYDGADRSVAIVATRREPEVTARVATMLKAEENRIAVKTLVTFTVRYAGVDEFAFTLPASLEDEFQVSGQNIREQPVTKTEDGRLLQRIVLQGKVTGDYVVMVEYDLAYGEGAIGVPVLVTSDTKRERGVYAVYRERMFEISEDAEGTSNLETIDPRELPGEVDRREVFLAFKYLAQPHALALTVTKHEYLPVLTAAVHHMHLVTLLNEEGTARTEVRMLLVNNGLQFLNVNLEEGAAVDQLEVGMRRGNRVQWKKEIPQAGENGSILVRLPPEAGPQTPFVIRLVYSKKDELPGMIFHGLEFRAPVVEGYEVPVIGTSWDVYPPTDVKITHAGGTLAWLDGSGEWVGSVLRTGPELFPPNTPGRHLYRKRSTSIFGKEVQSIAPRDQTPLRFGGRAQDATVEVTFANPTTFQFLRVLVFLVVLAGGVWVLRNAAGHRRAIYVAACVGIPLLLSPISSVGWIETFWVVLLGGLLSGLWWLALLVAVPIPGWVAALKNRTMAAPKPVSEEAPVAEEEPDDEPSDEAKEEEQS